MALSGWRLRTQNIHLPQCWYHALGAPASFRRGLESYWPWNQMLGPQTWNLVDFEILCVLSFGFKAKKHPQKLGCRKDKFDDIQYHIVPSLCRSAADQMEDQPVCCQPLLSCLWGYKSIQLYLRILSELNTVLFYHNFCLPLSLLIGCLSSKVAW